MKTIIEKLKKLNSQLESNAQLIGWSAIIIGFLPLILWGKFSPPMTAFACILFLFALLHQLVKDEEIVKPKPTTRKIIIEIIITDEQT